MVNMKYYLILLIRYFYPWVLGLRISLKAKMYWKTTQYTSTAAKKNSQSFAVKTSNEKALTSLEE